MNGLLPTSLYKYNTLSCRKNGTSGRLTLLQPGPRRKMWSRLKKLGSLKYSSILVMHGAVTNRPTTLHLGNV